MPKSGTLPIINFAWWILRKVKSSALYNICIVQRKSGLWECQQDSQYCSPIYMFPPSEEVLPLSDQNNLNLSPSSQGCASFRVHCPPHVRPSRVCWNLHQDIPQSLSYSVRDKVAERVRLETDSPRWALGSRACSPSRPIHQ